MAEIVTEEIWLDITRPRQYVNIRLQQNDVNTRKIIVNILDDGDIFTIPNGYPVYLRMLKPDNKLIYNVCSVENNQVIFNITEQISSTHGRATAKIEINDPTSGGVIFTVPFTVFIDEEVFNDDMIISTGEFTALQAALNSVGDFTTRIAQIGSLTTLLTTAKDSLVNAINELFNKIGNLSSLTTISNTNLVSSNNELNANKFDKANIIQTDTIGGIDKVASAEVTKAHGQEIDLLYSRFVYVDIQYGAAINTVYSIPLPSGVDDTNAIIIGFTNTDPTDGTTYYQPQTNVMPVMASTTYKILNSGLCNSYGRVIILKYK